MLKFFRDQRGGSGALIFIVVFILLSVILIQFVEPVKLAFSDLMLTVAYIKGLNAMQQEGGLTADIERSIIRFLGSVGFDEDNIAVDGTIAEVNWGEDVELSIRYTREYTRYRLSGLLGIESEVHTADSVVTGSTTSYYYDNNR